MIRGIAPAEMKIVATHAQMALVQEVVVEIPDGGTVESKLAMERGGFLDASIVDVTNAAVPGASFLVRGPLNGDEEEGGDTYHADTEGLKRVGPLRPGNYEAVLKLAGDLRKMGPGMSFSLLGDESTLEDSKVVFAIQSGKSVEARLTMPTLTTLTTVSGVVQDAAGPVRVPRSSWSPRARCGCR